MDTCLELVRAASSRQKPWSLAQRTVGRVLVRAYLHAQTPVDRIERAVKKEIEDLIGRADRSLAKLTTDEASDKIVKDARAELRSALPECRFPRAELTSIARQWAHIRAAENARREIEEYVQKHQRLEKRLTWLLDPEVTRTRLATLDPIGDADQLWCYVRYAFRPEILYCAWGNTMERISQIEAASTFFHATGKAEIHSVKRTEDTLIYYYYYFNWGLDSYHGRTAIETLNQIHGRYYIHNDGMKYVLLDGAFTLLDTLEAMAHRKLTEHERLGYFHATVKMGRAMNIADLTDSYDEMRTWFYDVSRAFAAPAPQKLRMWNALEDNFDRGARVPWIIGRFRRLIENVSMDESYRSALGFTEPSKFEAAVCRSVVRGVTKVRSIMPPEANIESLQNFITYPNGATLEAAGEKARSERMPAVCPFSGKSLANHGYPEGQRPLQRVEDAEPTELPVLSWTEVKHHNTIDDLWVVFGGHVYDLSSFARNHPGGMKVLLNHAGRDASKAFEKAKHTDLTKVFSLNFRIGKIESPRVIENAELATAN